MEKRHATIFKNFYSLVQFFYFKRVVSDFPNWTLHFFVLNLRVADPEENGEVSKILNQM